MANDPKMKFTLEVDDQGAVKFKRFGRQIEETSRAGGMLKQKFMAVNSTVGDFTKRAELAAVKLGALGVAAAGVSIGVGIKKAAEHFAEFEVSLNRMGNVTNESLSQVKARIAELPPELGNATQLVQGYYQVISAGVSEPVKAIDMLTVASKLSRESHIDQGEAVKGLSKLMAGYGDEMASAAEAADLLYTIEKAGQTSVAELIPVIGSLSKASRDLGISQEEFGASLAQITQFAGDTNEAATQYQATLTGLLKPSDAMKQALSEMGVESADAAVKTFGLAGTLEKLMESTGGSNEKMAALFGNVRALKGVQALADAGFKGLTDRIDVMTERTGAMDDAWERYQGTLQAVWDTLKNQVANVLIEIGGELAPALMGTLETTGQWLEQNKDDILKAVEGSVASLSQTVKDMNITVESISDLMRTTTDIIGGVMNTAKGIAHWFNMVGEAIGQNLAKFFNWRDKIRQAYEDFGDHPIKFIIEFLGKYNPTVPIGDAIDAVKGGLNQFGYDVSQIKPWIITTLEAKDDITGTYSEILKRAEGKTLSFSDTIDLLNRKDIEIEVDSGGLVQLNDTADRMIEVVDAAANKVEKLSQKVLEEEGIAKSATKANTALSSTFSDMGNAASRAADEVADSFGFAERQVKGLEATIASVMEAQASLRDIGRFDLLASSDFFTPIQTALQREQRMEAAKKEADRLRGYQTGTGMQGVPYTGAFKLHQGEIVLNPKQSEEVRQRGTVNGAKVGGDGPNITIQLSPMFMTGDRQSISDAVDDIIPELQRKMRRLGPNV